ncbi:hypothetical protein HYH03_014368 [Edaphochlamys debaryana]|uniref:Uncharacterized protein n=1 Tax=Edaphochlamys debaryana TaxID=47281 RepID=A0A835XRN6_9CHLO|nr:hypothetical protein HYH03_014368 [Edaphochlamys debaryana]|eukprot:KAG2486996.1 hypothetical protein HYH03_014368 [Edaphochlamys debaryana]
MQEVDEWYHENAERIWGPEKPSLEATRDHAKCLRSKKELREYFARYNAKKGQTGSGTGRGEDSPAPGGGPQVSGASDPATGGGGGGTGGGPARYNSHPGSMLTGGSSSALVSGGYSEVALGPPAIDPATGLPIGGLAGGGGGDEGVDPEELLSALQASGGGGGAAGVAALGAAVRQLAAGSLGLGLGGGGGERSGGAAGPGGTGSGLPRSGYGGYSPLASTNPLPPSPGRHVSGTSMDESISIGPGGGGGGGTAGVAARDLPPLPSSPPGARPTPSISRLSHPSGSAPRPASPSSLPRTAAGTAPTASASRSQGAGRGTGHAANPSGLSGVSGRGMDEGEDAAGFDPRAVPSEAEADQYRGNTQRVARWLAGLASTALAEGEEGPGGLGPGPGRGPGWGQLPGSSMDDGDAGAALYGNGYGNGYADGTAADADGAVGRRSLPRQRQQQQPGGGVQGIKPEPLSDGEGLEGTSGGNEPGLGAAAGHKRPRSWGHATETRATRPDGLEAEGRHAAGSAAEADVDAGTAAAPGALGTPRRSGSATAAAGIANVASVGATHSLAFKASANSDLASNPRSISLRHLASLASAGTEDAGGGGGRSPKLVRLDQVLAATRRAVQHRGQGSVTLLGNAGSAGASDANAAGGGGGSGGGSGGGGGGGGGPPAGAGAGRERSPSPVGALGSGRVPSPGGPATAPPPVLSPLPPPPLPASFSLMQGPPPDPFRAPMPSLDLTGMTLPLLAGRDSVNFRSAAPAPAPAPAPSPAPFPHSNVHHAPPPPPPSFGAGLQPRESLEIPRTVSYVAAAMALNTRESVGTAEARLMPPPPPPALAERLSTMRSSTNASVLLAAAGLGPGGSGALGPATREALAGGRQAEEEGQGQVGGGEGGAGAGGSAAGGGAGRAARAGGGGAAAAARAVAPSPEPDLAAADGDVLPVVVYTPDVSPAVLRHVVNGVTVDTVVQVITVQLTLPPSAVEALRMTLPR